MSHDKHNQEWNHSSNPLVPLYSFSIPMIVLEYLDVNQLRFRFGTDTVIKTGMEVSHCGNYCAVIDVYSTNLSLKMDKDHTV